MFSAARGPVYVRILHPDETIVDESLSLFVKIEIGLLCGCRERWLSSLLVLQLHSSSLVVSFGDMGFAAVKKYRRKQIIGGSVSSLAVPRIFVPSFGG